MGEKNIKVKTSDNMPASSSFSQHKYICDLYECEKQIYILEKRRKSLMCKIGAAIRPRDFKQSAFYKEYCREFKRNKEFPKEVSDSSFLDVFFGIIFEEDSHLILGAGLVFAFIIDIVVDIIIKDIVILPGLITIVLSIIIAFAVNYKNYYWKHKRYNSYLADVYEVKKYNSDSEKYNNDRYQYWLEKFKKSEEKRKKEFYAEEPYISAEIDQIEKELNTVKNTLNTLYSLRINGVLCLHPNYRGLIPISVIYGYFDTGRCTQLQGHEGAYNLYEDEKMKGIIINKLETVSKQLGDLQSSMVYVGQAIQECNSLLSDLEAEGERMTAAVHSMNKSVSNRLGGVSNQLSYIETNTANSAYYAEVGAKMATFNTVYNLLKD